MTANFKGDNFWKFILYMLRKKIIFLYVYDKFIKKQKGDKKSKV